MPSTANFCHACGESLPPDAAFCAACGTAVHRTDSSTSSPTPATRPSSWSANRRTGRHDPAFRRRVEDYLAHGWTVEYESDERVVLVNRGFGSILIHIALVFLTQGLGNLVYAWYSYSPGAPRRELRVEGEDRSLDDDSGRVSGFDLPTLAGIGVGAVGLPLSVWLFATGYGNLLVVVLFVMTLVLLGLSLRGRAEETQSPTTFGRKRTLTERDIGDVPEACADCGDVILDGVERRFAERTYVAGIPLKTHESGANRYCRDCAAESNVRQKSEYERERRRELA